MDDTKSCYQLIVAIIISEKTNTSRTNISKISKVKNPSILETPSFPSNEWYLVIVINSMIGGASLVDLVWLTASHCPITSLQKN